MAASRYTVSFLCIVWATGMNIRGFSDEIRAKWDKSKAELTKEYVRRHREGVKRRRRGGGFRTEEV
jgi:hypothetical protein